ncbi:MAG TPA: hypothetical protein ENJ95_19590 [Bacteroidetes bacterium]|nr:hypothetical protein [Bacteroidota bacterium]
MNNATYIGGTEARLHPNQSFLKWRFVQVSLLVVGIAIFLSLIFLPETGLNLLWNLLIPVAPLLFVIAVGVWRNICPLGTFSLLPHHFKFSKKKRLKVKWQGWFSLAGVLLLFIIVPFRHLVFDSNGPATAIFLAFAAIAAFIAGSTFQWKSGWCSGICPVHPVEKLYAEKVKFTPPNAHCSQCANCVIPCPDSSPPTKRVKAAKSRLHRTALCLLTGSLLGFIWGWFHVPDQAGAISWGDVLTAFAWSWGGALVSLAIFLIGRHFLKKKYHNNWSSLFAAAAVICYYWYRLPALFGFGLFPNDGVLVDLTASLPAWWVGASQILVVAFFGWWFLFRGRHQEAEWAVRPPFAVLRKTRR